MKQTHLVNVILVIVGLIGMLAAPPTPTIAQSAFDCATVTEIPQAECQALVALYNATAGDGWYRRDGWLQTAAPCSWFGVTCTDNHVSQLILRAKGLSGPLPPEIGDLAFLIHLDMASNRFEEDILHSMQATPTNLQMSNGITAVPPEIGKLSALNILNLSGNRLTALPPEFGELSALNTLDLSWNELTALPPEFGELSALKKLLLIETNLSALPSTFGNLSSLTFLDLTLNNLSALPAELGNLSSLTSLNLRNNALSALPAELGNLSSLTTLTLTQNSIAALPPEFGNLTSLAELDLASNDLTALPPEFGNLTNLTTLNLSFNPLTILPPEFGNLTHLTDLSLGGNGLTTLPPVIVTMPGLTTLNLSGNPLTTLPPEFGNLANLTSLSMGRNGLTALPPAIFNLSRLTNLYLNDNSLAALPPEFGDLTHLTTLDLGGNALTTLPPEFGNLVNLTTLNLTENAITTLPPEFSNLDNLTQIDLTINGLNTLPVEISGLASLARLDLSMNGLTTLPPEFGNLTNLTHLNLWLNRLISLPPEFGDLASLKWLNVSDNPTLRGVMPTFMAKLTSMEELHFDGTQWCTPTSGPVYEWLRHVFSNSAPFCTPLTTLTLDPVPELYAHMGATFTATAAPVTDHYPITFTWNTDAHTPVTHTSTGLLTDTIQLYWNASGEHFITVTAANDLGVVIATQAVVVHPVSSTIVLPDAPAHRVYTDTQGLPTTLDLPAGSVTQTATLLYHSQPAATAPVSWRPAGHSFVLGLYREGRALSQPLPAPADLTLRYSAADIAGIDRPADLQLMRRDAAGWQPAACGPVTHDLEQRVISLPLCQLGEFALFGPATLTKFVEPATPIKNGETLTYTLVFSNPEGGALRLFDPISSTLVWQGFVGAPPDGITFTDGAISGTLTLSPTHPLTLSFTVRAELPKATFIQGHAIVANTAYFCGAQHTACIFRPSNTVASDITSVHSVFLPLILR